MASTPQRAILVPRSQRPALHNFPASTPSHALTAQVDFGDTSNTPLPATPELEWTETPPATEEPRTPKTAFSADHSVISQISPLASRTADLQTKDIPVLNLSQLDLDVPRHLLSEPSSKTYQSERTFQEKLSKVTVTADSQLQPLDSHKDPPAARSPSPLIRVKEEASSGTYSQAFNQSPSAAQSSSGLVPRHASQEPGSAIVGSVQTEEPLEVSDRVDVARLRTESIATTSSTAILHRLRATRPLTLAVVWELNTKLSTVLPFETVERFRANPKKCVATTQVGLRCERPTAKSSNADFVTEFSRALSLLECSLDLRQFAEHMAPLIEGVTCKRSHLEASRACLEELRSYSWTPREIASGNAHQIKAISNSVDTTLRLWISTLLPVSTEPKDSDVLAKKSVDTVDASTSTIDLFGAEIKGNSLPPACQDASPKSKVTFSTGNVGVADTKRREGREIAPRMTNAKPMHVSTHLNHNFVSFPYSKEKLALAAQMLIRKILLKPITPADMDRCGFIYVFWHPGNFDYVKIGYSINVKKRLEDWYKQCGFKLEQHNSTEFGEMRKVRHLHRVESLIQAELKDYRLYEPFCTGCGKSHIEWFKVAERHARKVVAKWTSRSFYSGGLLESSARAEIDQLCELTEAETYPTQPRFKKSTKVPRRSVGSQRQALGKRHS